MVRVGIIGSAGRMGQALTEAIAAAGHERSGGIDQGGDALALAMASDVLVDFSAPDALEANLDAAIHARVPIVVGTTGLAERHHWLVDAAAVSIPVLQTGNTSLGVTLLAHLVREAAMRLGEDWDIEITETHHRMKVDAPSGTALLLGEAAAAGARGAPEGCFGARARRIDWLARGRHHRFCGFTRRQRGGGPHRAFSGRQRAAFVHAPRREPRDFCARSGARGHLVGGETRDAIPDAGGFGTMNRIMHIGSRVLAAASLAVLPGGPASAQTAAAPPAAPAPAGIVQVVVVNELMEPGPASLPAFEKVNDQLNREFGPQLQEVIRLENAAKLAESAAKSANPAGPDYQAAIERANRFRQDFAAKSAEMQAAYGKRQSLLLGPIFAFLDTKIPLFAAAQGSGPVYFVSADQLNGQPPAKIRNLTAAFSAWMSKQP